MKNKNTQSIARPHLQNLQAVARGDKEPDWVLKGVTVLDLIEGDSYQTNIAFYQQWIAGLDLSYTSSKCVDGHGLTIVPGFIDGHTHLESTLMHPFEFERITLPLGTTTVICDPHEIANVLGRPGIDWMLRCAEKTLMKIFVQIPSCVPSLPGFETNGAELLADDIADYRHHPHVLGLAEMMNYPGAISGDGSVLDKLKMFENFARDGHAPLVRGKELNAYRVLGIDSCHESVTAKEAQEKLRTGMAVLLREGSVAKNLATMAPIVHEFNSSSCMLCTDDRNPLEIQEEGHINYMVRRLITEHNIPAHIAYRLSSYSSAKHFNLKRLGLIAPGYRADFILLKDVNTVEIDSVYCDGQKITPSLFQNNPQKFLDSLPPLSNSMNRLPVSGQEFTMSLADKPVDVIGVIPNEITTEHLKIEFGNSHEHGIINKIAVVERYGHQKPLKPGLVKGFDLTSGAIASTVAHDSHNIVVVGANEKDMACAVNHLIQTGGGFVVVQNETIKSALSLPLAGLMSLDPAENIHQNLIELKQAVKGLGCTLHEPFLQMAFLALPVIPNLKITDKGVIDVNQLSFINYENAA